MKELVKNLETIQVSQAQGFTLIDTCYFIHVFEHHEKIVEFKEHLANGKFAMISFNMEELLHVEHHLNKKVKDEIRKFLKEKEDLEIIAIDVHPGDREGEIKYIENIDQGILKVIKDNSDGVLYATAIKIGADIVTRDKHHIYNQIAEKYANEHKINIVNKIV